MSKKNNKPKKEDTVDHLEELRKMIPKIKKKVKVGSFKKVNFNLDEFVKRYDDNSWRDLAQQNDLLWRITKTIKEVSDMSWKVAVAGAFTVLTGATKRDFYIDTKQEKLRLNVWMMILGYSGISRKSTTRRSIYEILSQIDYLDFVPPKMTPEALYDELKNTPNAQILGDEMGSFFKSLKKEYMKEMSDILSDIYDCKSVLERKTLTGGRVTVRDPYLRFYGGATDSIITYLDEEHFKQGFLPRFHFVLDFDLDERKLALIGQPNPEVKNDIDKVVADLKKIGELKVEALMYLEQPKEFINFQHYCTSLLIEHTKRGDSLTAPYYARLPWHSLKLAGILYLADIVMSGGTDLTSLPLPAEYIVLGTMFMQLFEQEYLSLVYRFKSSAPTTKFYTKEAQLTRIENLMKVKKGIASRTVILKASNMLKDEFDKTIDTLINNETIGQQPINKEVLVAHGIIESVDDKYPFAGKPPVLIWHKETFGGELSMALENYFAN